MSQLIEMRRRIKAIDTTQKITHAMQLVAMSTRLRLRDRARYLEQFQQEVTKLLEKLRGESLDQVSSTPEGVSNPLLIVIGANKGLCGTFNTNILIAATRELKTVPWQQATVLVVGKKFKDYIPALAGALPFPAEISFAADIKQDSLESVAHMLAQKVSEYSTVRVLSSYPVGFFVQKQHVTQPTLGLSKHYTSKHQATAGEAVLRKLEDMFLQTTLRHLLLQSLLAEQAARFVSMDAATRNAKSLKETMVLQFNKLRQWKITKELTELSSAFE